MTTLRNGEKAWLGPLKRKEERGKKRGHYWTNEESAPLVDVKQVVRPSPAFPEC